MFHSQRSPRVPSASIIMRFPSVSAPQAPCRMTRSQPVLPERRYAIAPPFSQLFHYSTATHSGQSMSPYSRAARNTSPPNRPATHSPVRHHLSAVAAVSPARPSPSVSGRDKRARDARKQRVFQQVRKELRRQAARIHALRAGAQRRPRCYALRPAKRPAARH